LSRRRLEDRIQDLVKKVCETDDADEAQELLVQLRQALQEHIGRLRKLAAEKLRGKSGRSRRLEDNQRV
jgi:hypothetical protein